MTQLSGGGGHSRAILDCIPFGGRLFCFDQDRDAYNFYCQDNHLSNDQRLIFIPQNFSQITSELLNRNIHKGQVNAILADLGISSHQIDIPERGFSYRFDTPLDMRMNQDQILTASQVVNTYPVGELARIFKYYGELGRSLLMAKELVSQRPINTTFELNKALQSFCPKFEERQFWSKVYQAIRIEVNNELKVLESFLVQATEMLADDGILAIITYHSLEDRLVKHFLATGNLDGQILTDFYGKKISPFRHPIPRSITPSVQELESNKRVRSARLRYNYKSKMTI